MEDRVVMHVSLPSPGCSWVSGPRKESPCLCPAAICGELVAPDLLRHLLTD